DYISSLLKETKDILIEQISLVLNCNSLNSISQNATIIVDEFFKTLPTISQKLSSDILATFNNDPAAECKEQIIFSYPGITAITFYRLAHELFTLKVPLISRIVTEYAHSLTGIDIHPGATIGYSFCIDHGTVIVIGETTNIGDNVKVYQGVTLGALSIKDRESTINKKRHPTIENNVTLYANCTVLGGKTVIGENSIIGGSTFIVKSIPANTIVSMELPKLNIKSQN
ncbi:MAG: serine acetyltransferase, partial [Clostridia bacterium]|nr:serine acetyltransferase [Clostridia bacterium]